MRMVVKPCEVLDQRNAVTFILALRKKEYVCMTCLMDCIPNYNSLRSCADKLEEKGLIHIDPVSSPRPSLKVGLTSKGLAVANHLQASADIIHGHITLDLDELDVEESCGGQTAQEGP